MDIYAAHMCLIPARSEKGIRFSGTEVRGLGESTLDPVQEQYVLLTVEPSLQPISYLLIVNNNLIFWN